MTDPIRTLPQFFPKQPSHRCSSIKEVQGPSSRGTRDAAWYATVRLLLANLSPPTSVAPSERDDAFRRPARHDAGAAEGGRCQTLSTSSWSQ